MKTRFRNEADDWNPDGSKITAPEKLEAIRDQLENRGPVIVEHWHYRGSSAPDRLIFEDFEMFSEWLREKTFAGDAIDAWAWATVCKPEHRLTEGKCPDERGLVPRGGAY
jgi:hypothetical protein